MSVKEKTIELIKKQYKSVSEFKNPKIEAMYASTISKVETEYNDYIKGEGNYSVLPPTLKMLQLEKNMGSIKDDFLRVLLSEKTLVLVELEELQKKEDYVDLLNSKTVFNVEGNVDLTPAYCSIM